MIVRLANENELNRINELRKQLFDLHASNEPDVFEPEDSQKLQDAIYDAWNDPEQNIVVVQQDGSVCGYAVMHHIITAETPIMLKQDFLNVDEICVDEAIRGQGIARAMIDFIREYAVKKGFHRIALNVWEFNQKAIEVYETKGFHTYKRSMEMNV